MMLAQLLVTRNINIATANDTRNVIDSTVISACPKHQNSKHLL